MKKKYFVITEDEKIIYSDRFPKILKALRGIKFYKGDKITDSYFSFFKRSKK